MDEYWMPENQLGPFVFATIELHLEIELGGFARTTSTLYKNVANRT